MDEVSYLNVCPVELGYYKVLVRKTWVEAATYKWHEVYAHQT